MIIKNSKQLKNYQKVALLSTDILKTLIQDIQPGVYPIEIDSHAKQLCQNHQAKPAFQGVPGHTQPYDYATCISVNDSVVHGIPSSTKKLKKGDIVKLDFGLVKNGFYTDQCVTVIIGEPDQESEKLVLTAKKAIQAGVAKAIPNNTVGDIGSTIHSIVKQNGYDVLKQYVGHAIGLTLHEQPNIPAHGKPAKGETLKKGMVLCIEAQVVTGSDEVYIAQDSWTVKMKDKGNTAMFEYMVVVADQRPIILTPTLNWPIVV